MNSYANLPPPSATMTLDIAEKIIELVYDQPILTPDELRNWVVQWPDDIKQRLLRHYQEKEMYKHCAVIKATL